MRHLHPRNAGICSTIVHYDISHAFFLPPLVGAGVLYLLIGMHYIEGGWPGSNPKDVEFFERARTELPSEAWAKVVAFGRYARGPPCGPPLRRLVIVLPRAYSIALSHTQTHPVLTAIPETRYCK